MRSNQFFSFFLLVIFVSCSDNPLNQEEETDISVDERCVPFELGLISPGSVSALHPSDDFIPEEFDWENAAKISFRNTNGNDTNILLPWASGANKLIPRNIARDVKRSDGWRLLYDTFQYSKTGIYTPHLFLLFYNEYRGTLKLLYYRHSASVRDDSRSLIWTIGFTGETSLLNQSGPVSFSSSKKFTDRAVGKTYTDYDSTVLGWHWQYAEYQLAYDPDILNLGNSQFRMILNGHTSPINEDLIIDTHTSTECFNQLTKTSFFTASLSVPGSSVDSFTSQTEPSPFIDYPLGVFTLSDTPKIMTSQLENDRDKPNPVLDKDSFELNFNPHLVENLATIQDITEKIVKDNFGDFAVKVTFSVVPNNGSEPVHFEEIFEAEIMTK